MTEAPPVAATCRFCAGDVSAEDVRCPHCGQVLKVESPGPPSPAARKWTAGLGCVLLGVMLAVIALVIVFGRLMGGLLGPGAPR